MKLVTLHKFPIKWLHRKLDPFQFLLLSAIFIGLTAGIAAVTLKSAVHYINEVLTGNFNFQFNNFLIPVSPLVGIVLTVLVVMYLLKGRDGKGISGILHEIAKKSSIVPKAKMYSQLIASSITVGLGGSSGLEGPITVTGAAIGSNFGRVYHVNYKNRTILLAAGAAAGISAVFNAPVTGVMFAFEVLLAGVAVMEFIPIILASATGALFSMIVLNDGIILSFGKQETFNYANIPLYILLGVACGLLSVYYARISLWVESLFHTWKRPRLVKALVGGLILSVLCFLFPPFFGEGYESIKILADGDAGQLFEGSVLAKVSTEEWALLLFIGLIGLLKVFAVSVTLASGGSGGNFAPSLFTGAYIGYFFSSLLNKTGWVNVPVSNFTLVGMAGMLSGVFYAPLTAVFLIAEVTGGYQLFIPLMVVAAIAFFLARQIEPFSMEKRRLAKKGEIFTDDQDKNILTLLRTSHIIETDVKKIDKNATLRQLVELIKVSRRNFFAVVDTEENLLGIVILDDIKEIMFDQSRYDSLWVEDFMKPVPAVVDLLEDMKSAMKKFDETQSWNLPVVENGKYRGFISKSSILTSYRNQLMKQS